MFDIKKGDYFCELDKIGGWKCHWTYKFNHI